MSGFGAPRCMTFHPNLVALAAGGHAEEARDAAARARAVAPDFSFEDYANRLSFADPERETRMLAFLRDAGVL